MTDLKLVIDNPPAFNPITGTVYKGGNQTLLTAAYQANNYSTNEWCTYPNAQDNGGQVLRGQKGVKCTRLTTPNEEGKKGSYMGKFTLFNYAQIQWAPDNTKVLSGKIPPEIADIIKSSIAPLIDPNILPNLPPMDQVEDDYADVDSTRHYEVMDHKTVFEPCPKNPNYSSIPIAPPIEAPLEQHFNLMSDKTMKLIAKFRKLANGMQGQIDGKCAERLTNTAKRQAEGARARMEGDRLKRVQSALIILAELHEEDSVPASLAYITTKAEIYRLVASKIEPSRGYYDAGFDTGKPKDDDPIRADLWALLDPKSDDDIKADKLRDDIESLQFSNIPGYFPTPPLVVALMIEKADLCSSHVVLEPSAGSGSILDAIRPLVLGVACVERQHSLIEVLKAKGYTPTEGDFMLTQFVDTYDRILMNPPFEMGQDIDHVRRAFDHLGELGRLVAIMTPAFTYSSTKKAREFREFVELHGGDWETLPPNSFKSSGTNVSTVIVTIDK